MIEPSSVKISAFDGNLVDKLQAVSGQAQAIKKQRQVWPLTKFHSVDFSQSRSGVKKCNFNKLTIKIILCQLFWTFGVLGLLGLAWHTWQNPCFSVVLEARHKASRGPLKGTVSTQKAL